MTHLDIKPYISEEQLKEKISSIGQALTKKFKGKDVVAICVLKGSFMFYSDLIREIDTDISCEFFGVSSYHGTTSSGEVKVTLDLAHPIEGKHVVLVEDIVDTGLTLAYLQDMLRNRAPRSLRTACLLSKPSRRKIEVPVEYIGFEIPDRSVIGYGLDVDERYRNLPEIGVITGGA